MRPAMLYAAVATSLALVPSVTMAQSAGSDSAAGASVKMKGPPNANGAASGDGMPDRARSGRSEGSGSQMKGPPNADGAPGARGSGLSK